MRTSAIQQELLTWPQNGYLILRGFFSGERMDAVNAQIEELLNQDQIGYNYSGVKLMNAWEDSEAVNGIFRDPALTQILSFLLGKTVVPFQTINFLKGSQQKAHSDSIHMTTQPPGYLIASWIAFRTSAGNFKNF